MQKPIKIGILINKGGAGKTTTTVCLADALLNLFPKSKALIIDADDQSNIKTIFRLKIKDSDGGLSAVLREGLDPSKLFHEVRPNLSVMISGGRALADFATEFRTVPESEYLMRKRFENLSGFDFILVDSPPSLSLITTNIATFVDYVLIPATPDLLSLVGVKNLINLLQSYEDEERKKARPNPIGAVLGVVPTQVDQRRNIDLDIIEDLERLQQSDLLNGGVVFDPIRVDSKVRTAQVKRKLLSEAFPKANAAEDYQMLAREIISQIEKIKGRDPILHLNRESRRFNEADA